MKVFMEIQFAEKLPQDKQSYIDNLIDMINGVEGKFYTVEEATWQYKAENNITDEDMTIYKEHRFDIEIPPEGRTRCDDCIKFILPNTCPNDLLSLLKVDICFEIRNNAKVNMVSFPRLDTAIVRKRSGEKFLVKTRM